MGRKRRIKASNKRMSIPLFEVPTVPAVCPVCLEVEHDPYCPEYDWSAEMKCEGHWSLNLGINEDWCYQA